jgi:hypothetical protein
VKNLRLSGRGARRWLAGAGAIVITGGLSGVALAADAVPRATMNANAASAVIKGCFNRTSGSLRVLTSHSRSCGSERKISWNQKGRAGNGYAFKTTPGTINKFSLEEADGPVVKKVGTYFVNVNAQLNIAAYTRGGSGFCALDITDPTGSVFVFEIFSAWDYSGPGSNVNGSYPFASSGMVYVAAKRIGYQFVVACFDNSFTTVRVKSAVWTISPVSARSSDIVGADHTSRIGPAGFRPKPARKL